MKRSETTPLQQSILPKAVSRWKALTVGLIAEALILIAIVSFPLLFPDRLTALRQYAATMIVSTPVVVRAWKPTPPRPVPHAARIQAPLPPDPPMKNIPVIPSLAVSAPAAKPPRIKPDETPQVSRANSAPAPLPLDAATIPKLTRPRAPVQVGGFGDPNGLPTTEKVARTPNITQLGGFNLPPDAGKGNGAARDKGILASVGFGNSAAIPGPGVARGVLRDGQFDSEYVTGGAKPKAAEPPQRSKPLAILFKPRPVYTELARTKKIEGEVVLEVLFSSTGEVRVLRIIQALGYGLDGAAEQAASQIRFRPAQNDQGLPVDSTAVVHILFKLAY